MTDVGICFRPNFNCAHFKQSTIINASSDTEKLLWYCWIDNGTFSERVAVFSLGVGHWVQRAGADPDWPCGDSLRPCCHLHPGPDQSVQRLLWPLTQGEDGLSDIYTWMLKVYYIKELLCEERGIQQNTLISRVRFLLAKNLYTTCTKCSMMHQYLTSAANSWI